MKVLAIIDLAPDAPVEEVRRELPNELKGSWDLFAKGVLREAYLTEIPTRVVFILEAADMTDAEEQLERLPLVAKGAMRVGLIELRPFANWSKLFAS
jgi:hypothetical protein